MFTFLDHALWQITGLTERSADAEDDCIHQGVEKVRIHYILCKLKAGLLFVGKSFSNFSSLLYVGANCDEPPTWLYNLIYSIWNQQWLLAVG